MNIALQIIIILMIIIFIVSCIVLYNKNNSIKINKDPNKLIKFVAMFLLSSVLLAFIIVFSFLLGQELIKNIAIVGLLMLMLGTIMYLIF